MSPQTKATLFCSSCLTASLAAWIWIVPDSATAIPHAAFYVVLIINTYFSIVALSSVCSRARHQAPIDAVLTVNYLLLAAAIGQPSLFELFCASLFALAALKYALLPKRLHLRVIKRKIVIDILGLGLSASSACGIVYWISRRDSMADGGSIPYRQCLSTGRTTDVQNRRTISARQRGSWKTACRKRRAIEN